MNDKMLFNLKKSYNFASVLENQSGRSAVR